LAGNWDTDVHDRSFFPAGADNHGCHKEEAYQTGLAGGFC